MNTLLTTIWNFIEEGIGIYVSISYLIFVAKNSISEIWKNNVNKRENLLFVKKEYLRQ